jgi:hypothetical protein
MVAQPVAGACAGVDLSVQATNLTAQRLRTSMELGTLDTPVLLTARVHAQGGHFGNVAVEFFEGNPRQGGKRIGRPQVIPVIWAGSVGTAQVIWDTTGKYGFRDIYVKVHTRPVTEETAENNVAMIRVPLVDWPFRFSLPTVFERWPFP